MAHRDNAAKAAHSHHGTNKGKLVKPKPERPLRFIALHEQRVKAWGPVKVYYRYRLRWLEANAKVDKAGRKPEVPRKTEPGRKSGRG